MTREEAIRLIGWLKCTTNREDDLEAIDMAIEALQAVPNCEKCAIKELWKETEKEDLVSVVRCKDCRHAYFKDFDKYCRRMVGALKPNQFCSFGELAEKVACSKCKHKETCEDAYTENSQYCNGELAEQTEGKMEAEDE